MGIPPFPLDDPEKLEETAQGFRNKSCGKLFRNVIGVADGYLLRISPKCLKHQANAKKYWCRKQFYAVNCQVTCDSHRRVTYLSIMCPGATPDILAHCAGPLHAAILTGKVDKKWQFLGDAAFPSDYQGHVAAFLIPFTRADLRDADTRHDRDSYNYYLSQLRIIIECCFGMMVNKFRVISRRLETTSLKRAILTFQACCALHNFVINCRLALGVTEPKIIHSPNGYRLVQRPGEGVNVSYVVVPTVVPDTATRTAVGMHARGSSDGDYVETDRADEIAPTRGEMVLRVALSGYIRPRIYGVVRDPYVYY